MARKFLAPTATCSLVGSSAAFIGQTGGYVWFGLATALDQSACAAFYNGSANTDPHLWTMAACRGFMPSPIGPFCTTSSLIYVQVTGTRASALIAYASS